MKIMDIQIVIHSHNEILLSNTKEWTIGLCDNIDLTQNNYAEQKTPHTPTRVHTL